MEFVTDLYRKLDDQLGKIELETADILTIAKQSYHAVESAMGQLKTFITSYTFRNAAEEIYFFKELKPKFYSKLIYFMRLFEVETNRPEGSIRTQRKYLYKRLDTIKRFSKENITFYKYYRSGASYMDAAYFTRDKFDILIGLDVSYFDCDQSFCTSHDLKAATLLANEELVVYLNKGLLRLNCDYQPGNKVSMLEELGLTWAETKAAFVELMYGLHDQGAFYNTKTKQRADIKDIARFFEIVCDMDLGNYYRTFQELSIRKKGRTVFLDKIKDGVIKRMNERDENT